MKIMDAPFGIDRGQGGAQAGSQLVSLILQMAGRPAVSGCDVPGSLA
jgi:hypothetical protein